MASWARFGRLDNTTERQEEQSGGADEEEWCFLEVYVHDACNMYGAKQKQDVYAKLALTSAPDHAPALSTRFDQRLPPLRVRRARLAVDVLKCELWMRRPLLDDQLLGFALVPLASVAAADGARLAAREFELSSTDLLHSPAGTIRLSLALHSGSLPGHGNGDASPPPPPLTTTEPSITSEVVILYPAPPPPPPVTDYVRIEEFPDLNVVRENHDDMAVQYLPFLQLGDARSPPESEEDLEVMMSATSPSGEEDGEKPASSSSDVGSRNASTTTTASHDRAVNKGTAIEKKPVPDDAHESTAAAPPMSCRSPETPTSSNGKDAKETKGDDVFTSPLGGIDDMDADEQSEMQRQIMEMYVRSMQQFSGSMAKMNMPIVELDGVVVHKEKKPQNDGAARVFYGSRAFF